MTCYTRISLQRPVYRSSLKLYVFIHNHENGQSSSASAVGTTFGEELARTTATSILVRVSETIRILASVLTARSSMSKDVD